MQTRREFQFHREVLPMSWFTKRSSLGIVIMLATVVVAVLGMIAAVVYQPAQTAPIREAPTAGARTQQVFELRIYTAAAGKIDALNQRFRDHTLRLFEKHGIKSIGYWTAIDEQHHGRLYYIVAYPDRESREKMLVNGIAKDPEFREAVARSEKEGKLAEGVESVLMVPTDYSPIK
jgi:hypothetical protein